MHNMHCETDAAKRIRDAERRLMIETVISVSIIIVFVASVIIRSHQPLF